MLTPLNAPERIEAVSPPRLYSPDLEPSPSHAPTVTGQFLVGVISMLLEVVVHSGRPSPILHQIPGRPRIPFLAADVKRCCHG